MSIDIVAEVRTAPSKSPGGSKARRRRTEVAGCAPISGGPLAVEAAERLAGALKAVADPARLRILSLLEAQPDGRACVCHLTGPLGLTQPTVSHHLKILAEAGLVSREQRGTWAHYRVDQEQLTTLARLLG